MTAARRRADCAAVLLRAGDPIRKTIVGRDAINLRRCLVVPGTPGHRAIDAHNRALIGAEHHAPGIVGINPELMKVIARGIAFDRRPGLAGVGRAIHRRVHHVNGIGVLGIGSNFLEVPTAIPQTLVAGKSGPGYPGIV